MTERQTDALERLNRGIEDSRAEVQRRTMNLAQDYFGDSADTLKRQISENRSALQGLPDQVPGGREEAFQMMFQELMDNYTSMEQCISEAQKRVADLDTDNIRRQGDVDATDAARRDAREFGVDLTEVEGSGAEGRITVDDVKAYAEQRRASGVEDQAEQAAEQAQDVAEGATQQAQNAAGQVTDQASQVAGQTTDQVGEAVGQAQGAVGGLAGERQGGGPLGGVTDQLGQVAGQAQDAVGGATDQVGQVAGQATDQAGEVAGQAQDAAGGAVQQAQDAAGQGDVPESEIDASDAARREAKEKGIDLRTIKGTGADGRIVYWDVSDLPPQNETERSDGVAGSVGEIADQVSGQAVNTASSVADQAEGGAGAITDRAAEQVNGGEPRITKAARRKADELGKDISQISGSGSGGLITMSDVVRA